MQGKIELNEQLAHYSITASGQITQGRNLGAYAGYAAAVGAGLAIAGGADASIIYSGVQNIAVAVNPALQATALTLNNLANAGFDMDGGGVDFTVLAGMAAQLGAGYTQAKYVGLGALQPAGGAAFLSNGAHIANLAAGALIGPAGAFAGNSAGYAKMQVTPPGGGTIFQGAFANGTTGFVGIRLGSGNYGWIRLRLDDLGLNQPFSTLLSGSPIGNGTNYIDKLTVIDWAYETSGGAIAAGATASAVPEPSSLALLAAGAAGLAAFRRRKVERAVVH